MGTTVWVLWIFLVNGNVVTREYPDEQACLATREAILVELNNPAGRYLSQSGNIKRMLCVAETARG